MGRRHKSNIKYQRSEGTIQKGKATSRKDAEITKGGIVCRPLSSLSFFALLASWREQDYPFDQRSSGFISGSICPVFSLAVLP
jgi:hypothetical protein